MCKYVSLAATAAVGLSLSLDAPTSQAATLQAKFFDGAADGSKGPPTPGVLHQNGNDCSGYFGSEFDACNILVTDDEGTTHYLSPVIAKLDFEDWENRADGESGISYDGTETDDVNNTVFDSVDGQEFSVGNLGGGDWSWSYNPQGDDPVVRYVSVKHKDAFTLYWMVADSDAGACAANPYTLACLSAALPMIGGEWNIGDEWSHITFFDTAAVIPLPAGLILFLTGLAGIGALGRYKSKRREVPSA